MGIYFPNAHLQFYSSNFGWLLLPFPFLQLQQPLCIYSREHNVTFVFSRIWPRRLCSCKRIQVLGPAARRGLDIEGRGSLHTWSAELPGSLRQSRRSLPPACHLLPTSVLQHPLNSGLFFFSRIALLFNFEYYFQWFLWGELRHEGLEQSLCWRIFSCSFDVISCCCSQIQLNCTIRRIPVCKLWNTVTAAIKSQHLINIATYHWLADTTVFALMQAENYSGVWYCTWIRLRTFKPPCNWTNEIKSPNPSMKKQNIHNLWTSLWTYEPCSNTAFSLDFKKI